MYMLSWMPPLFPSFCQPSIIPSYLAASQLQRMLSSLSSPIATTNTTHHHHGSIEEKGEVAISEITVRDSSGLSYHSNYKSTMAKCLTPCNEHLVVEDEYIDMNINSSPAFLCYNISSPPHSREFEFQMSSAHQPQRDQISVSPADELFYKGQLLPLHLPPRLQMVEMLLRSSTVATAPATPTANTAATTPIESCDVSPANSCRASGELNAEEYFCECSGHGLTEPHTKKVWSQKLKLLKGSSLSLKLKASRAYLRSLFSKTRCPQESYTNPKANASTLARSTDEERLMEEECGYRRSFSGVTNWHSTTKSSSCSTSSSSSSSISSGQHVAPQMLKRSSSVNSEMESSIQGAIAYCKESQQPVISATARKSVSDVGFCSLMSASRISADCEKKEKPGLCRG